MHLSRKVIDAWTGSRALRREVGTTLVKLNVGDSMDIKLHPRGITNVTLGPGIVALTVHDNGEWSAREAPFETPEAIYWETL